MRDRFANSFKAGTSIDVSPGLVVLSSDVRDVDIGSYAKEPKMRACQIVSRSGVVQQCLNHNNYALSSIPPRRLLRGTIEHHW